MPLGGYILGLSRNTELSRVPRNRSCSGAVPERESIVPEFLEIKVIFICAFLSGIDVYNYYCLI